MSVSNAGLGHKGVSWWHMVARGWLRHVAFAEGTEKERSNAHPKLRVTS